LRRYKRKSVESEFFEGGWVTLEQNFRWKGASPINRCFCQKSRVRYGIEISAASCTMWPQFTNVTDGQTSCSWHKHNISLCMSSWKCTIFYQNLTFISETHMFTGKRHLLPSNVHSVSR